ncbi:unnamed protein product [Meloidogyne enterolobii]|uniref:Uncharacterized protein n=1 Tax=Meloidogyne enterolobii TaxID=390850 RepID=A0ACB1AF40_MELEN
MMLTSQRAFTFAAMCHIKSLGDVLREHSPTRSSTGSSSGEDQNSSKVGPNEWVDFK